MLQPVLVIQTPAAVKVRAGSTVRMECSVQPNSPLWYIRWFKNGTENALTNRISIITNKEERCSHLILSKTEIADSGIYRCILYDHTDNSFSGNGIWLTIDGKIFYSKALSCICRKLWLSSQTQVVWRLVDHGEICSYPAICRKCTCLEIVCYVILPKYEH